MPVGFTVVVVLGDGALLFSFSSEAVPVAVGIVCVVIVCVLFSSTVNWVDV